MPRLTPLHASRCKRETVYQVRLDASGPHGLGGNWSLKARCAKEGAHGKRSGKGSSQRSENSLTANAGRREGPGAHVRCLARGCESGFGLAQEGGWQESACK